LGILENRGFSKHVPKKSVAYILFERCLKSSWNDIEPVYGLDETLEKVEYYYCPSHRKFSFYVFPVESICMLREHTHNVVYIN